MGPASAVEYLNLFFCKHLPEIQFLEQLDFSGENLNHLVVVVAAMGSCTLGGALNTRNSADPLPDFEDGGGPETGTSGSKVLPEPPPEKGGGGGGCIVVVEQQYE